MNLVLVSMILVTALFVAATAIQNNMLTSLTKETSEKQLSAVTTTTAAVIDTVITQNMDRITDMEAQLTDEMFRDAAIRVGMVADYAGKLLDNPGMVQRVSWNRPDASRWRSSGSSPTAR